VVEVIRAIILFADIHGSTEFGYSQPIVKYNEMLRDFHETCHKAIKRFRRDEGLSPDRVRTTCRGDECCAFLRGGEPPEDERLAMRLAIYLKELWKQSRFCRLTRKARGLIPQVDLRIGIGSGEVALDHDVWSGTETLEGIRISEAKRIEGMADAASGTLIMVKLDIMEACIQAGEKVEFGPRMRLQGKGVPDVVEVHIYPVKTYGEWSAIQKKVVPSPKTYFERFAHAEALRRSGDLEGSIREYGEVLKLRPDDPDVLRSRGEALYDLGRYGEALVGYNRALELRPDDPNILDSRGGALGNLGRHEEALADYNRSLDLHPDDPTTLNNRGVALEELGRYEDALASYNRSLELRPNNPATLNNRGFALAKTGRLEEALTDLDRSLDIRPKHPGTMSSRALALVKLGQQKQAFADFARALALKPDDPEILYDRACAFSVAARWDESLRDLSAAIAGSPRYRADARQDPDLAGLRANPEFGPQFQKLMQEEIP
jgi:Flp pilus assembly protein TadD